MSGDPPSAYAFLDIEVLGLPSLQPAQLTRFSNLVIADMVSEVRRNNSADFGFDGTRFCSRFLEPKQAAAAAIQLRDFFSSGQLEQNGFPASLSFRIVLDFGEAVLLENGGSFGVGSFAGRVLLIDPGAEQILATESFILELEKDNPRQMHWSFSHSVEDFRAREFVSAFRLFNTSEKANVASPRTSFFVELRERGFNDVEFHIENLRSSRQHYIVVSTRNSKLFSQSHSSTGFTSLLREKIIENPQFLFRCYFLDPRSDRALRNIVAHLMRTYAYGELRRDVVDVEQDLAKRLKATISQAKTLFSMGMNAHETAAIRESIDLRSYIGAPVVPMAIKDDSIFVGFPAMVWSETSELTNSVGFSEGPFVRVSRGSRLFDLLENHERLLYSVSQELR
jgi:hypothetical protein